jgi:translation initiation factor 1A|tara:strand:- start:182 stop:547 length:366 start_codon:yes stop_codon:yes gene_type:complete
MQKRYGKAKKKGPTLSPEERQQQEISRIKLPRDNQVLGVLDQRLGASRTRVRCLDGKTRICRIPGRLKRRLWVREGDIIIVMPWEFGGDEKGDILYKYTPTQVQYLKRKGHLKKMEEMEEF